MKYRLVFGRFAVIFTLIGSLVSSLAAHQGLFARSPFSTNGRDHALSARSAMQGVDVPTDLSRELMGIFTARTELTRNCYQKLQKAKAAVLQTPPEPSRFWFGILLLYKKRMDLRKQQSKETERILKRSSSDLRKWSHSVLDYYNRRGQLGQSQGRVVAAAERPSFDTKKFWQTLIDVERAYEHNLRRETDLAKRILSHSPPEPIAVFWQRIILSDAKATHEVSQNIKTYQYKMEALEHPSSSREKSPEKQLLLKGHESSSSHVCRTTLSQPDSSSQLIL